MSNKVVAREKSIPVSILLFLKLCFIYVLLADENSSSPAETTNWETLQGMVISRG